MLHITPSQQRARIAWISPEGGPEPVFRKAFRDADYGLSELKNERFADVAIIDFRKATVSAKAARKLAATARRSAPHGGVIYLADPLLDAARRSYLRRSGDLVLTTDNPNQLINACRNRIRARNLAEEAGERIKSLAEDGALKPVKDTAVHRPPYNILVAGKPSPLTLSVMTIARRNGYNVEGVLSPSQAMNAIESNNFDSAVFLPSAPSDPLRSLATTMMRQTNQRDFPVLIVADEEVTDEAVILAHQVEEDLADHLAEALRRANQTKLIRHFLSVDTHYNIADKQTKSVNASFFAKHGARLLAQAKETDRPLSIIAVSINANTFKDAKASDIAAPLYDASVLINSVTRTEDMLARIAPTTFILTLPSTTPEDADRAAGRITGVLENTMFKLRDPSTGDDILFSVSVNSCAIGNSNDLCLEEMVATLLSKTKPASVAKALNN